MLYPQMTPTRMQFSLDGVWDFRLMAPDETPAPGCALESPLAMPVPASYNEMYPGRQFRDYVGRMAYQRTVAVAPQMLAQRLVLHFASVTHKAEVFWNGELLGSHIKTCVAEGIRKGDDEVVDELVNMLQKLMK